MLEIRIAICLITLIIASIMDFKKREISDKVWILAAIGGIALFIIDFNNIDLTKYGIALGITAMLSYIIYRTGLFGGADAKALMIISLLLPFYDMENKIHDLTSLAVLTNGVILTIANIFHNVIRNVSEILKGKDIFLGFDEPLSRKIFAFILGFRISKVSNYAFLMEVNDKKGKRFRFHINAYDDFADNAKDVWVTPALPFIIYITIGFIIAIVYGDIVGMLANFIKKD